MFSGKTEKLISILENFTVLENYIHKAPLAIVFKPIIDMRYNAHSIASHSGKTFPANPLPQEGEGSLWEHVNVSDVGPSFVAFDEIQFFGPWIVGEVQDLVRRGANVVASGLDLTFKGEPFGPMPQLLCLADEVVKLTARCSKCGGSANRSQRTVESVADVLVGGAEAYEPRCGTCFRP